VKRMEKSKNNLSIIYIMMNRSIMLVTKTLLTMVAIMNLTYKYPSC
jgi:hypothetical protein